MSDQLEKIIRQVAGNRLSEAEVQQLQIAIETGEEDLTVRGRKISLGDAAKDSFLIAGDRNVVIQNIVTEAPEAIPVETNPSDLGSQIG